jgi:hypothetical protein
MNTIPRFYGIKLRHCIVTALGASWFGLATYSVAQITAPNGSQPRDDRTPATGSSSPNTPASGLYEGYAPQSKDAKGDARARPRGKQNPGGATGFDNGLYGTGSGGNK